MLQSYVKSFEGQYQKIGNCHNYIQLIQDKDHFIFPNSPFINYSTPKSVSSILQSINLPKNPLDSSYTRRSIYEFPRFNDEKREKVNNDLSKYEEYINKKENTRKSYQIIDTRSEQAKEKEREIFQRILDMRGESKTAVFNQNEFREATSEEDLQFEIEESREEEEEFRIVIEDEA